MLGATLTISIDILRLNDDEKRPGMEIGKIVWRGVDFVGVNGFSFIVVCEVRCWEGVWWTPDTSYHKIVITGGLKRVKRDDQEFENHLRGIYFHWRHLLNVPI